MFNRRWFDVWHLLVVAACALAFAQPAAAHPVPFSYVDIQLQPDAVEVSLVAHIFDIAHDLGITPVERLLEPGVVAERAAAIQALVAARMDLSIDRRALKAEWSAPEILAERQSLRLRMRYPTKTPAGAIALTTVLFPYDLNHQTFVNTYEYDALVSQMILDRAHSHLEYFAGTRQGVFAVIRKFIPAGIHHILIGPDHLLFLVGLLLLGGSIRQLLRVVTSFTVAHSVTLSLAALNILSPPARIIEPAIALSIVYVGAD